MHVMLHVNRRDGLTIAAFEARFVARTAQRTVLSDDALADGTATGPAHEGTDPV